jgi:hypothetical protein
MVKHLNFRWKLLILTIMLLFPTGAAIANSRPPPYEIYFQFVSKGEIIPIITGLQVVGCSDIFCSTPLLIQSFGSYESSESFLSEPPLTEEWILNCAENECRLSSKDRGMGFTRPFIQLTITHKGQTFLSEIVTAPKCDYCTTSLLVDIQAEPPTIQEDGKKGFLRSGLLPSFGFSTAIELITAGIFSLFWRKKQVVSILRLIGVVFLSNTLSYPIAWMAIPYWGNFSSGAERKESLLIFSWVLLLTISSILILRNKSKIEKGYFIAAILSVPVCLVSGCIGLAFVSYGGANEPIVNGLPTIVITLIAELFAVGYEAMMLRVLLKDELSLKRAVLLATVMNAASFGLGLLIF